VINRRPGNQRLVINRQPENQRLVINRRPGNQRLVVFPGSGPKAAVVASLRSLLRAKARPVRYTMPGVTQRSQPGIENFVWLKARSGQTAPREFFHFKLL